MRSRKKPEAWQRIARERMQILFEQAEEAYEKHPERSKRYVGLARKIGMRFNVRMTKRMKASFCRKCGAFLKPGANCRIRTRRDRQAVVATCLACGGVSRHPYIKEKGIIKQGRKRKGGECDL